MNRQLQYYAYEIRRRSLYLQVYNARIAYYNQIITNLRNAVAAGVDIRVDPRYREQYLLIHTELGDGLFVFEDNNNKILKKEENK